MKTKTSASRQRVALAIYSLCLCVSVASCVAEAQTQYYYPPAGSWAKKAPAEVGMDPAALEAAVQFAKAHETSWLRDFSTQNQIFGTPLGCRAPTNSDPFVKNPAIRLS